MWGIWIFYGVCWGVGDGEWNKKIYEIGVVGLKGRVIEVEDYV